VAITPEPAAIKLAEQEKRTHEAGSLALSKPGESLRHTGNRTRGWLAPEQGIHPAAGLLTEGLKLS
jgi:hypothetical protein